MINLLKNHPIHQLVSRVEVYAPNFSSDCKYDWHICLSSTPRNSQASFKLGMSYEPPCFVEESDQAEINRGACVILNTTAIRDKFQLINKRFNLLFAKRAFVHWYVGQGRVKYGDD